MGREKPSRKVITLRLSQKSLDETTKLANGGNIQAKLDLIIHNQGIMNDKLNKLLTNKE